ncbi:hypothetical protein F5148DRAFT_1372352 [Russula earlei]|uniref:Uncharacterized protein n=1 Tax=Russula earlei TaxID=71964 RepID=A0ACC0TQB4_9AGAM|nr:hypothetical protein F5148DRAFT_1372352 [Russula earlei]
MTHVHNTEDSNGWSQWTPGLCTPDGLPVMGTLLSPSSPEESSMVIRHAYILTKGSLKTIAFRLLPRVGCTPVLPFDLNLHILPPKKLTTEQHELDMLNRTQIWIICFNIDKSTATQFRKPLTLTEDFIVRKSLEWYKSSPNNHSYDMHIITYTLLFRVVNKFHQEVFSDPTAVTLEHDRLLTNCRQEWAKRFERDSDHSDAACEFRVKLSSIVCLSGVGFARFAGSPVFLSHTVTPITRGSCLSSFGFQMCSNGALKADDEVFFTRSAKTVVTVLVDSLVPTGYIHFAPDGCFVFAAFTSAFILKVPRPAFYRSVVMVGASDLRLL